MMATAGILEPIEGAKTTFEPLITTSPDSMKIPAEKLDGLPDVAGPARRLQTGRQALHWPRTSPARPRRAFPDGPPKPPEPPSPRPRNGRGQPPTAAGASGRRSRLAEAIGQADQRRRRRRHRHARRPVLGAEAGFLRPARRSSRPPTTAISSPTRSRCWPAATISSACAAAAPRRGRSRSSSGSSATPTGATAPRSDACRPSSRTPRPSSQPHRQGPGKRAGDACRPSRPRRSSNFRADMVQTRRQLRDVQPALRQDIGRLQDRARILRHRADPDPRRRGRHRPRRAAAAPPQPAHHARRDRTMQITAL